MARGLRTYHPMPLRAPAPEQNGCVSAYPPPAGPHDAPQLAPCAIDEHRQGNPHASQLAERFPALIHVDPKGMEIEFPVEALHGSDASQNEKYAGHFEQERPTQSNKNVLPQLALAAGDAP